MAIVVGKPDVAGLSAAVGALREWQREGAPMQLHPGDLGWHWRFGAETTAGVVRTWSRDGRILAVGLIDGPGLLRMTIAPEARRDEELARRVLADLDDPERHVLPPGEAYVEAPMDAVLREVLAERGWVEGERWTALRCDLAGAVPVTVPVPVPVTEPVTGPMQVTALEPGPVTGPMPVPVPGPVSGSPVRVEVVGPERVAARVAIQRAAFEKSTFSEERWHVMAAGELYADARCLVAYDEQDNAVAAVTVWSAGPGRPGLLEPMGVHRDHRGRGYGTAITRAGADTLRELGASSALVATESSNAAGVATYNAAGFESRGEIWDMRRKA